MVSQFILPVDRFATYRFPFVALVVARALTMDLVDTCSSAVAYRNRTAAVY